MILKAMHSSSTSQSRSSSSSRPSKRPQVLAACNQCRKKKIRCSADRPRCKTCVSRDVECIYDTFGIGETRQQASHRRQSELETENTSYAKLFDLLKSLAPQRAQAGLQLIRAGLDPQEVLIRLAELRDSRRQLTDNASPQKADESLTTTADPSRLHARETSMSTRANMRKKRRTPSKASEQNISSERNHSRPGKGVASESICPFDSMFNRSETQWSMTLVDDLDQCLKSARSALPFLQDQEQALIPSASSLATAIYDDDLLFTVAGLVTCSTFPVPSGQQVSRRPNLVWCRDSILRSLQSQATANKTPSQNLVGVVALLSGWEWVRLGDDVWHAGQKLTDADLRQSWRVRSTRECSPAIPPAHEAREPTSYCCQQLLRRTASVSCSLGTRVQISTDTEIAPIRASDAGPARLICPS